jgi:hypothetical protein
MLDRCPLTLLLTSPRSLKNNDLKPLKLFLLMYVIIPIKIKMLDNNPIEIPKKEVTSILVVGYSTNKKYTRYNDAHL